LLEFNFMVLDIQKTLLVTGASGFIGKNLLIRLKEKLKYKVITFSRNDKIDSLGEKIKNSDQIIHLASEIRPKNRNHFDQNLNLAKKICEIILQQKNKVPIIFYLQ